MAYQALAPFSLSISRLFKSPHAWFFPSLACSRPAPSASVQTTAAPGAFSDFTPLSLLDLGRTATGHRINVRHPTRRFRIRARGGKITAVSPLTSVTAQGAGTFILAMGRVKPHAPSDSPTSQRGCSRWSPCAVSCPRNLLSHLPSFAAAPGGRGARRALAAGPAKSAGSSRPAGRRLLKRLLFKALSSCSRILTSSRLSVCRI